MYTVLQLHNRTDVMGRVVAFTEDVITLHKPIIVPHPFNLEAVEPASVFAADHLVNYYDVVSQYTPNEKLMRVYTLLTDEKSNINKVLWKTIDQIYDIKLDFIENFGNNADKAAQDKNKKESELEETEVLKADEATTEEPVKNPRVMDVEDIMKEIEKGKQPQEK